MHSLRANIGFQINETNPAMVVQVSDEQLRIRKGIISAALTKSTSNQIDDRKSLLCDNVAKLCS